MRRLLFFLLIGLVLIAIIAVVYLYISANRPWQWRLHFIPSPEIEKSKENYHSSDLVKFFNRDPIQYFSKNYTANKKSNLKEDSIFFLKSRANNIDLSEESLIEYLNYVSPDKEEIYLVPVIVERARYNGEESLIIVQTAGKIGKKLKQGKIWVIRLKDGLLITATATEDVTDI